MKKLLLLLSSITIVFGLEIPKNHLVDSDWLEKNQNEKNLVIIDTRDKVDYEKEHIKNAVNYPKNQCNKGKNEHRNPRLADKGTRFHQCNGNPRQGFFTLLKRFGDLGGNISHRTHHNCE